MDYSKKILDRFWDKVDTKSVNECWVWLGYKSNRGYGRFRLHNQYILAHRFSWMIHNGDVPEGLCVCHSCDNPSCINPYHLFLGTQVDNSRDCVQKGRHGDRSGELNGSSKLTNNDVIKIREMLLEGYTGRHISSMFGVDPSSISYIKLRKTWRYV